MKNAFRKIHRVIVWYSIISAPITIAYGCWISKHDEKTLWYFLEPLNNLGFLWILSLLYVFLALLFYKAFRESLLARLAGFQESDEREQLVTAHAARNTFLLMLAIEIVFLVMRLTSFHLVRYEKPNPTGHHGLLTLGMGFSSEQFDIYALPSAPSSASPKDLEVGGNLLPSNMTLILLLLILVQVGAFKFTSRRYYAGHEDAQMGK